MMANGGILELPVSLDWRTLAFTGAISLLACVFAGLAPGLSARRANVNPALKQVGGGHRRLGRALVMAQLCISMTLLVGASLFIRTLIKLYSVDTGLRTGGVLSFNLRSKTRFPSLSAPSSCKSRIVDRLQSLPGVILASASEIMPRGGALGSPGASGRLRDSAPGEDDTVAFNVQLRRSSTSPSPAGTPAVVWARSSSSGMPPESTPVAIVNESLARAFFGGQPPLGRHVTSVGIAYEEWWVSSKTRNTRTSARPRREPCISRGLQRAGNAQPNNYSYLARVAGGDPMRLAPLMERAIPEIDSSLRLLTPQTFEETVGSIHTQ